MLNRALILAVAKETGIDRAFIEKDWYNVQLLKLLNGFENDRGVKLVFAGGTSLSKGLGLIQRFSEDLDLILCSSEQGSAKSRSLFRKSVISHITSDPLFTIEDNQIRCGNRNRFFTIPVKFDTKFTHEFMRPHLQLDMTFADPRLPLLERDIQSVVSEQSDGKPETKMPCVSPVETASDKVAALAWRVIARDRNSDKDDPTMVRHLHDLAALEDTIRENEADFVSCVRQSLQRDRERRRGGDVIARMKVDACLKKAYEMLSDDAYRVEYAQFVQNMSFAGKDEQISFDQALAFWEEIIAIVKY